MGLAAAFKLALLECSLSASGLTNFGHLKALFQPFFRGCRLMKPSLIYAYNLLNNAVRRLLVLTFAVESPTFTHRLWDVPCLMEDLLFTLCTEPRSWGYMYAREAFRELGQESHFLCSWTCAIFIHFEYFWVKKLHFHLVTSDQWGFQSRLHNEMAPQWVAHARLLARKHLEEWRIPSTENIVARFRDPIEKTCGNFLLVIGESLWHCGVRFFF